MKGSSLDISGRVTIRAVNIYLLAFGLMLTGQFKRGLIWIQTEIMESEAFTLTGK